MADLFPTNPASPTAKSRAAVSVHGFWPSSGINTGLPSRNRFANVKLVLRPLVQAWEMLPLQAAERWTDICNDAQRFLQPQ